MNRGIVAGRVRALVGLALAVGVAASSTASAQDAADRGSSAEDAPYLVVVSGIGGTPEYVDLFHAQGAALVDAAAERWGVPRNRITWLAEDAARAPGVSDRSTKEKLAAELAALSGRVDADDRVLIVLIGHGTATPDGAKLNLPGPDLTGGELGLMLDALPTRRVAVVAAASASGGLLPALAAEGRIVVTATRSAREAERTHFGEFFVRAFAEEGADTDKNRRVSLGEAYAYARDEVARYYEREGQLQTEHPMLDDGADGRLAAAFHLAPVGGAATAAAAASNDPVLGGLLADKARLESEIAALRARRADMEPADYDAAFEALALDLATTNRAIRDAEADGS